MKLTSFFLSIFLSISAIGQRNFDSLWNVWNDPNQADTLRLEAIKLYAWEGYLFYEPDSAIYFSQLQYNYAEKKGLYKYMGKALNTMGVANYLLDSSDKAVELYHLSVEFHKKAGDPKGTYGVLNNIGNIYYDRGDFDQAIKNYEECKEILLNIGEEEKAIKVINNLGMVYSDKGDYSNAMDYFNLGLKLSEKYTNKTQLVNTLNNIGIIYSNINEHEKAIDYFRKCLSYIDDSMERYQILEANAYNNLGNEYGFLLDYKKSMFYYNKSIEVKELIGDEHGIASTLFNIGDIYYNEKKYDLALDNAEKAMKIFEDYEDVIGVIDPTRLMAKVYFAQDKNALAIKYGTEALNMAQEYKIYRDIEGAADLLVNCYIEKNDYKKAFEMYDLSVKTRDELLSEENQKEILSHQYQYAYERKAATDSLKIIEEKILSDSQIATQQAQLDNEKTQRYALYGGVGLLLFFGGFMYNRFRITRKQKDIIELQKNEVEGQKAQLDKKNQEILDSIIYAKRIQSAILPPERIIKDLLKESFVLYKPKDVVAGDFYWVSQFDDTTLFAAADCTGHGVPGAMVSVVCNNALNRSVREYGLSDPAEILNKVREIVVGEFEKADEDVKDGMDIALCSIQGNTLKYAGANIPLILIQDGAINVTKPDKQPIGKYLNSSPYTNHQFELKKGDTVYILSDGFVDQFGGPQGKKFKAKAFRKELLRIHTLSMEEQFNALDNTFTSWKGSEEQVDDVCVIGYRH